MDLSVSFPPLPEQQRIVAILDEAFAGAGDRDRHRREKSKNAQELVANHLDMTLGQDKSWPVQRLEEIVDDGCSLSYGIVQPGDEQTDGLPIVRPVDMTAKIIHVEGLKRINASLAEAYSRTRLRGRRVVALRARHDRSDCDRVR